MHKQGYQIPSNGNLPQKLSLLYIEQGYFHRIQIRSLASLYKLNVKLKKPIILSLHTLPVLKHIIDHSQATNAILQMDNIHEIKLDVPGYGVFNQKYQLQRISELFLILSDYCQNVSLTIKKITLNFPGWRTFSNQIITNFFKFIIKCQVLQQFTLNINHAMCINSNSSDLNSQLKYEKQNQDETFYGKQSFQLEQFQLLMKYMSTILPKNTLTKLELRFGAWKSVGTDVLQILIQSLKKIFDSFKSLKTVKIDLHGWGTGNYQLNENQIQIESVNRLFRTIEEFDGDDNYEILQIDMRNWPAKYGIKKYKEKFQYLSAVKRKDDVTASNNLWSMTGTNFFGSQLKSRINKRIKVEIKD